MPVQTAERHMTVKDICDALGVVRSTFYDWRASGDLDLPSTTRACGGLLFRFHSDLWCFNSSADAGTELS